MSVLSLFRLDGRVALVSGAGRGIGAATALALAEAGADVVVLARTAEQLEAVAEQALLRGTGARGLRAILEEVLLEVMYDLPSRTDVSKCVIDRAVVLDKVHPTLVPLAPPAKTTRSRRAAS